MVNQMNAVNLTPPSSPSYHPEDIPEKRSAESSLFILREIDPREVVDGVLVSSGFLADDVVPVGKMREVCPYCVNSPLQLVLRHLHVKRSHLYCQQCTRCFEAFYPDGRSALTFD
jgi:hypothetical protein